MLEGNAEWLLSRASKPCFGDEGRRREGQEEVCVYSIKNKISRTEKVENKETGEK